jgi:hypothetical protein
VRCIIRAGLLCLSAAFLVCSSQIARADVGGKVSGVISDSSGAAIRGATVTLSSANTGFTRAIESGVNGFYQFLAVPVGNDYQLRVDMNGFETDTQSGIVLQVNQDFAADFKLKVGSVSERVNVSAEAIQVESTSTQLGTVIDSDKMQAVPLNGRSFIDLMALQAGVVPVTSGVDSTQSAGEYSVNGQRESANSFEINGITVERAYDNGASVVPVLDAVEEFRILTSTFDAEYGRFSGGVVNVVTKSGTNAFHGSVFEFLRNNALDARGYFDHDQVDPVTGAVIPALPKLEQNQFGGTLGGPVLKNRLFFFGDYQGTRLTSGVSTGDLSVPSTGERAGDFSNYQVTGHPALSGVVRTTASNAGTMDQVLTQRLGYTVSPGESYWTPGCNTPGDAAAGICVFPGAVIPQAAWSPAAIGSEKFIPAPTFTANGAPYYSSTSERTTTDDNTYEGRVDLNTQRAGNLTIYYHYDGASTLNPFGTGNVPGFPALNVNHNQNVSLGHIFVFGPTAVNEAHVGFTRSYLAAGYPSGPFGKLSSYGFVENGLGIVPGNPSAEGLPFITLGLLGISVGLPDSFSLEPNNIYQFSDAYSKTWGTHTAKFGGDFRYGQFNIRQSIEQNGVFGFEGQETGNDFADFLIGTPDTYGQANAGFQQNARTKYLGLFGQDSWKLRPNLTMNYGLRYDLTEPFYDTKNEIQAFIPGLQSKVFPNSPEGWVFPGDGGLPSTISPTRKHNFAPRLGVAYSPGFSDGVLGHLFGGPGKSSIRVGTGLYYTTVEEAPLLFETGDAPFGLFYTSPALVYLEQPFKSRTSANDPGQRFPIPAPTSDVAFSTFQPISGSTIVDPRNVTPRTMQYNVNFQRQLTSTVVATVAFVGSGGRHLITQIEANPGNAAECLQVRDLYAAAGNAGGGCGPNGEDSIYTINGQTFNGTRPYSVTSGRYLAQGLLDFGGTLPYATTSANSAYNSFQVTVEKRAGALQLLAAYTYSKSMDNSSGFGDGTNPYNPRLSWSLSAFDVTNNFVASYSYNLPFDRFGAPPLLRPVISGWNLSGITRFNSGLPVTISQGGDNSLCGCQGSSSNGVDLPNYSGGPIARYNPRNNANHQYFDTSPFTTEEIGVPGNSNRRFFHGPGSDSTDIALLKNTPVKEGIVVQFRAEFFNAWNHANFLNPGGNFATPIFGQITSSNPGRIGQVALKVKF